MGCLGCMKQSLDDASWESATHIAIQEMVKTWRIDCTHNTKPDRNRYNPTQKGLNSSNKTMAKTQSPQFKSWELSLFKIPDLALLKCWTISIGAYCMLRKRVKQLQLFGFKASESLCKVYMRMRNNHMRAIGESCKFWLKDYVMKT
jgi:hypothetical protein